MYRLMHDPIEILLVEDNPGDVRLIRETMREGQFRSHLAVAQDGVEALEYLRRQGKHEHATRPHLIMLDLNLPKKDGREVLAELKSDPDLASIPVVVLTSSKAEMDVLQAYNLRANAYVTKPVELDDFIRAVRSVENFWLSVVRLPHEANR